MDFQFYKLRVMVLLMRRRSGENEDEKKRQEERQWSAVLEHFYHPLFPIPTSPPPVTLASYLKLLLLPPRPNHPPPSPNPSTSTPSLTPLISPPTHNPHNLSCLLSQSRALSLHLAVVLAPRQAARY